MINPPMFLVMPGNPISKIGVCLGEGLLDAGGRPVSPTEFTIRAHLIVARADVIANVQDNLDTWLGFERTATAVSVGMAIAMDPTLGGTVEWCECTTEDSYAPIEIAGIMYFGARLNMNVSAR
jgi:hypothetical protein